jgi:hypothetical protein
LPDVYCSLGTDCTDCGPRTPGSTSTSTPDLTPGPIPGEPPAGDAGPGGPLASDWLLFSDPVTGQVCDTVNGVDFEAIVLSPSQELMIVSAFDETGLASSADSVATGLTVDDAGNFIADGVPTGAVLAFAAAGDGTTRLWALLADGTVLASATSLSGFLPAEFRNVRCEACDVVDLPPPGVCAPSGEVQ